MPSDSSPISNDSISINPVSTHQSKMGELPAPRASVVIPTLTAGPALDECLQSLAAQTMRDFEVIVVDNSGERKVPASAATKVIHNARNLGFGGAINQGFHISEAPFLATLNDDAIAHPKWLESLLATIEKRYEIGMCASQVRLYGQNRLDSAGMLISRDGSSKQRGHLEPPDAYPREQEVLLPSGSAALYRRDMLQEIGLFDDSFFLYCEDTDLGLRGRWAAWECMYVPQAIVEHRYSHSAGRVSPLKAFYVERNRLFMVAKNFPGASLLLAPVYSSVRYFWHAALATRGHGAAAEFSNEGHAISQLPLLVARAHWEVLRALPRLWKQRRAMKKRLTTKQFRRLLRQYSIGVRQVAAL